MLPFPAKFLVPNGFTAFSMLCGLFSVVASSRGDFAFAAWLTLWGVLLDKLDGSAARLLKASSEFGVQYDSFADFVVFGIAPGALVYYRLADSPNYQGPMAAVLMACVGLYVVAVSGRLARFNISSPPGGDLYFYGIPTTMMGALFSTFYLTVESRPQVHGLIELLPLLLVAASYLMVSSLKLPKLKMRKNKALNAFQLVNLVVAYILAPLMLLPEVLLAQALLYLVAGVLSCLVSPPRFDEPQGETPLSA